MSFLDRIFGGASTQEDARTASAAPVSSEDSIAVERYRYLLRTAPPETIEQVHREAFAKLTEQQRALVYEQLSQGSHTGERPLSSEPATLARSATRAELRSPGTMERVLGSGAGGAGGFASTLGGSLLGTVAGYVIGSALVSAFLPWDGWGDSGADAAGSDGADASAADAGSDFGDFGDFGF